MTSLTILNDVHIGAIRSAGTTPATAYALRQYILQQFELLLDQVDEDVLILGDLFDTGHVPYTDLWEAVQICSRFMQKNPTAHFYNVVGNHDLEKTTTTMSSFQLFSKFMEVLFPGRYTAIFEPTLIEKHQLYAIGHMINQEQFDIALKNVPAVKLLALHCNYNNAFAVQADHSLNLSEEQAKVLPVERIVMGHEHQRKMGLTGKVMLPGNQVCTSIADALGNSTKYFVRITSDKFELMPFWEAKGSFQRIDWRELGNADASAQFIRVEGDASSSEAPAVVTAISKLRKAHGAFVITNAVKIEGREDSSISASMDKVANFNVVEALFKLLTEKKPAWAGKVKKIMEENDVSAA